MIGPFRLTTDHGRRLAIPPVLPTDTHAPLWAHSATDTTCTQLAPDQLRVLAEHLTRAADLMTTDPQPNGDPPCPSPSQVRPPWSNPRTSSSPA